MKQNFVVRDLGTLDYLDTWELQLETHAAVATGEAEPTLLLVEHPPVITFGKKGGRANLIMKESWLKERGFSLYDIERGGDVTYHGPGQLVGYPIFKIGRHVRDYLRLLEQSLIHVLKDYGIHAMGSPGYAGVWIDDAKVAAIGVAVKRDVSFHGFALNVNTQLEHFNYIVPCGISDKRVTSMQELLGREMDFSEVKAKVLSSMQDIFSLELADLSSV